jgi:RNA polymerase sigma-70 factor (ECF subfamily)
VPDDVEILRTSINDPAAFEELFHRYFPALLGYARRRVGHDVGEEIAARTMVIAFERRGSFDPKYLSARPWLYGIASNLIRHHIRDERVHVDALGKLPIDPDLGDLVDADRLDAELERPLLTRALMALEERDREAFLLFVLEDLSYDDIATALDIPVGTVRSRIHRARGQLRERIARERERTGGSVSEWTGEGPEAP